MRGYMNILILGASGFIGTALSYKLEKNHNLILVSRSEKKIITKNHPIITWNDLEKNPNVGTVLIKGYNQITECNGVFFQFIPFNDICMFGNK